MSDPDETHPSPLELDPATVRRMVRDVLDRLLPWLERSAAPDAPMGSPTGGHRLAAALRRDWPEQGTPWPALLADLERARAAALDTTSGGYLAYVPGGGLPHAAVADLYADLANRFTGLWMCAPGLVALEIDAVRWLCRMVGYGDDAGGILTSGGSLANLGGLVAARHRHMGDADPRRARVYRSAQAHHSIDKAARIAGLPVVDVPVDDQHRLRPDVLDRLLRDDLAQGAIPVAVVASAGTTALGAVDDLDAIASVCASHGVWLHVDAAYGGFFALTDRGRAVLQGLERADSVVLDPHKGLFLPYGTGCLLVRDRDALREAHAVPSAYLPAPSDDPLAWDLADLGPELSRPYRGLRVWLPLAMHGFGAFRAALGEKLDLAQLAAEGVRQLPHVRLVSAPVLSLFAFRAEPPGLDPDATDAWNRRWLLAVNRRRRVFLSGAKVHDPALGRDVFALRVCVLSFRTHADRIASLVADLAAAAAEA
ncbi:MAG: aminotransferase class I/II-fold pyridoxal phosphate-dependent enzyme [Myxococcota bacterium]